MDNNPKNYELAYLLPVSIPEGEVLTHVGNLTSLIEENKGVISRVEKPGKRRLAYPIKKEQNAYFGYTTFSMKPEFIISLDKKIKGQETLRYFIIEEEQGIRPQLRFVSVRTAPPKVKKALREESKEEEGKLDLEALDKKLEEILGK